MSTTSIPGTPFVVYLTKKEHVYHSVPRSQAAMSGSADAVRFLLERNPSSLEAKDQEGRTALHLASGHRLGSDGTLTTLLAAGADMEAKTALGETSLLKACKALRVSTVRILLRWGADEAAVDADGRSPVAVVSQLLQSQHPGVFRDMLQTILGLLKGAPADRVWRRRGWLLMVRSSLSRREGFHQTGGGGGGGGGDVGGGKLPCCREGIRNTEGCGGGDGGRSSSRRESFQRAEGGGGEWGRLSSGREEGFQRAEDGGDGGNGNCCERPSIRRERCRRTKGGCDDSVVVGTNQWARCPPRELAGVIVGRVEVEKFGDNDIAGRSKKVEREGAVAALLHPRANRAARENNIYDAAWYRARTRRAVLQPESALERARGGGVRFGGGEHGDRGFRSMVERAMGVEEDGVFRSIVAFL